MDIKDIKIIDIHAHATPFPEYTARFIEEFSDRILMGYDICLSHQTHQYTFNEFMQGMVEKGYVTKENYYKIVRGNAEKLLKL